MFQGTLINRDILHPEKIIYEDVLLDRYCLYTEDIKNFSKVALVVLSTHGT